VKILFVTQWFDPEPGAMRGLPLARHFVAQGDEVEVLTGYPNYPGGKLYPGYRMRPWSRQMVDGVSVLRVPLYPSHDSSAAGRLANYGSFALSSATIGLLTSRPADVAYVYHPPPTVGLAALLLKTLRHTPFVYHIADMWPESVIESGMIRGERTRRIAHSLISSWCGLLYRQASAISVLSPGFKRLLDERGVPGDKVHVIYNWAEEHVFKPLPRDAELAASLNLDHTFNLLYAGNLGAFQGIDTAIRAAARLRDVPSFRLVIAGAGQKETELKSLASQLSCSNVVFIGRREYWEMPKVYSIADALLIHLKDLPFFASTIPSKTQVSMACGRPILVAVRGDAAELISRAGAGLSCNPEDPEAMAAAVRRLMNLPAEERMRMGAAGRSFYEQHMSMAEGAQHTRRLLEQSAYGGPAAKRAYA